ncbi:MAG: YitT family protein [Bacteroidetes bacterium]|nr:YitT family protein [Bacteroidota bacterium]
MSKLFSKRIPVIDYLAIAFGAAIMAIGIGVFLVDAKVVPGGVSGLSMAFYYLTGGTVPRAIIWREENLNDVPHRLRSDLSADRRGYGRRRAGGQTFRARHRRPMGALAGTEIECAGSGASCLRTPDASVMDAEAQAFHRGSLPATSRSPVGEPRLRGSPSGRGPGGSAVPPAG